MAEINRCGSNFRSTNSNSQSVSVLAQHPASEVAKLYQERMEMLHFLKVFNDSFMEIVATWLLLDVINFLYMIPPMLRELASSDYLSVMNYLNDSVFIWVMLVSLILAIGNVNYLIFDDELHYYLVMSESQVHQVKYNGNGYGSHPAINYRFFNDSLIVAQHCTLTAGKFFVIDHSTIVAMISAVISYTIIIYQNVKI